MVNGVLALSGSAYSPRATSPAVIAARLAVATTERSMPPFPETIVIRMHSASRPSSGNWVAIDCQLLMDMKVPRVSRVAVSAKATLAISRNRMCRSAVRRRKYTSGRHFARFTCRAAHVEWIVGYTVILSLRRGSVKLGNPRCLLSSNPPCSAPELSIG